MTSFAAQRLNVARVRPPAASKHDDGELSFVLFRRGPLSDLQLAPLSTGLAMRWNTRNRNCNAQALVASLVT